MEEFIKKEILKQTYEVTNSFDTTGCITAISSQLHDNIFKELINNEKHSLTLTFTIHVNEEVKQPEPDKLKESALDVVSKLLDLKLTPEQIKAVPDFALLYFDAAEVEHLTDGGFGSLRKK